MALLQLSNLTTVPVNLIIFITYKYHIIIQIYSYVYECDHTILEAVTDDTVSSIQKVENILYRSTMYQPSDAPQHSAYNLLPL